MQKMINKVGMKFGATGWLSRKASAIIFAMALIGLLGIGQLVGLVQYRIQNGFFIQAHQLVQPQLSPKKLTPKKTKPFGAPQESPCYQLKVWGYS